MLVDDLFRTPGERGSAVRGNGDASRPTGVPGESAQLLSAGQVPEPQRLVATPEERAVRPSGAMATLTHRTGVPGEGAQLFSAGQIPELQRLIPLPESAVRPSGAMATLSNPTGVPGKGAQLFSGGQVPELQRLVPTPRSAVRPSGAMATLVTASECPVKVRSSFPLARSQSFSVLSSAPRERGSAVRGDGDAGHSVGVPGEGAQLLSAGQVPELQRLVLTP